MHTLRDLQINFTCPQAVSLWETFICFSGKNCQWNLGSPLHIYALAAMYCYCLRYLTRDCLLYLTSLVNKMRFLSGLKLTQHSKIWQWRDTNRIKNTVGQENRFECAGESHSLAITEYNEQHFCHKTSSFTPQQWCSVVLSSTGPCLCSS